MLYYYQLKEVTYKIQNYLIIYNNQQKNFRITQTRQLRMKTHLKNTKAIEIYTSYDGKNTFANHQHTMHGQKIKPTVETRRKQEIKIVNNNKRQINEKPFQHVNKLFKNITQNKYKSTIDNKVPDCYEKGKKILKDRIKKNPKENFIQQEHERQLRSQASRLKNCKSLAQRKKDNTDPIVNPTYFMREGSEVNSVTIQGFKKTVLKKNRPLSGMPANQQSRKQIQTKMYKATKKDEQDMPKYQNFGNVPNMGPKTVGRPKSAGYKKTKQDHNSNDDLPNCTFKALLNHIIENKMYKDADMKVLYVRLCHKYGDQRVDQIWQPLMDQLQR